MMQFSNKYIAFIMFLLTSFFALSQDTRIEIKLNRLPKDVEIIPLSTKGFLLKYSGGERRGNSYNSWNMTKFNSNFEEEWNKLIDVPSRFSIAYQLTDTLSKKMIWVSKSVTQLRLDIMDLDSGKNSTQTYNLPRNSLAITSALIVKNSLYLLIKYGPDDQVNNCYNTCCFPIAIPMRIGGMSVFKHGGIYLRIDLINQLKYEVYDISKSICLPDKIQANHLDSETISISQFKLKAHSHGTTLIQLKKLNPSLKTLDSFDIEAPKNSYLQNLQLKRLTNSFIGIGTFNNRIPYHEDDLSTIEAQGIYSVILDSSKQVKDLKLFKFNELKSFEGYLKFMDNRKNYSEYKSERLKRRYKNYATLIKVNEIIERPNDIIVTTEAFYPVYSSYRDVNGNLIQYFEGYNYTNCIVVCFDKQGNIKWDKTIPLNFDRLYTNLNQKVNSLITGDKVQLFYGSGGIINIVTIQNDTLAGPEEYKLRRLVKEDAKVNEFMVDVIPWLNQTYLIWGVQKIKKSDDKSREGNTIIYIDELTIN